MIQHFENKRSAITRNLVSIFKMLFVAPSYKKMRTVLLERNLQMREKLF
jgi:hypothetical protein